MNRYNEYVLENAIRKKGCMEEGEEEKEWCGERDRGKQAKRRMNSRSGRETKEERERGREGNRGRGLETHIG